MVQFRKSKSFGPLRLTLSNRGLSTSVGSGPLRMSRGADGAWRRTVRVPGAGIYDTEKLGQKRIETPPEPVAVTTLPTYVAPPVPSPPTGGRKAIVILNVLLGLVVLALIGNCAGGEDESVTTTITSTVTRTVQSPPIAPVLQAPTTVTAPPVTSTVTVTADAAPPVIEETTPIYVPPPDLPESSPSASYSNCSEARAAGAAPLYRGDPGYSSDLDREGDGVACE